MSLKKMREVLLVLLLTGLAVSPAIHSDPAYDSPSKQTTFQKPYGGTLVIGHSFSPRPIDPVLTDSSVSVSVMGLIFNRLVRYDSKGEIAADLAESWTISSDGLVYNFKLRKGIRFHDGSELTSADVLYTYEMIQDPARKSPYSMTMNLVESFKAPDPYTFRVTLKSPNASFIYRLVREIVSEKDYRKNLKGFGTAGHNPLGTGPFRIKEWRVDDIILEANDEHFNGRPYLDQIIYRNYANRSEVWSALMRQEIDLAIYLTIENYEITKKDPSFITFAQPTSDYYSISYNLSDPTMQDHNLRLAIAHAIDRDKLIHHMEKGYGSEAIGPFNENSWAFNPSVKPLSYDPSAAIELLNRSGWKRINDGILERDGKKLLINMLVNEGDEKVRRMASLIRQSLQEVGIGLKIDLYKNTDNLKELATSGKYQAALLIYLGPSLDPNEIAKFWSSGERASHFWQSSEPQSSELDELIARASKTFDKIERRKIYHQIHSAIYEQQPACFLYFPFDFHAVSERFGGTQFFLGSSFMPDDLIKEIFVE